MQYGSYKTVRELAAGPTATVYLATDDSARSKGQPRFAVKVFTAGSSFPDWQTEESANATAERANEFLRSTTRQKNAHAGGACHVAAVRDGGQSEAGAWFATDYYPRTAQKLIEGRVALNRETVHHILSSAVRGALEFKALTGEPHGNIKPANVLIGGASNLLRAPVVLIDPSPGGNAAALELADLRAVGELIFRLVRRRDMSGADQWPIEMNLEWKAMFEDAAQQWLTLCNWLLDPNLSLAALNLEGLQNELARLKPKERGAWIKQVAIVGAVVLLSLGVWWLIPSKLERKEKRLRAALVDASNALAEAAGQIERRDWVKAQQRATAALATSTAALAGAGSEPRLAQIVGELMEKEVSLQQLQSNAVARAAACDEFRASAIEAERREAWAEALQGWSLVQSNCLETRPANDLAFVLGMKDAAESFKLALAAGKNNPQNTSNLFAEAEAKLPASTLWSGNVEREKSVRKMRQEMAQVLASIIPPNRPPVATGQAVAVTAGEAKSINLTGSDPENLPLNYVVVEQPKQGRLSGAGPMRTYTTDSTASGNDTFTFKVNDGAKDSQLARVSITISKFNQPPVASNQTVVATAGEAKPIILTGSDPENSLLNYVIVEQPKQGRLSGAGPMRTYTTDSTASGNDTFTFKVNDGAKDSQLARVSITISKFNQPPVASNQTVVATAGEAKPIILTGSDPENSLLNYVIVEQPKQGRLSGAGPMRTYTTDSTASGSDSFTFKVSDGVKDSSVAMVSITISRFNQPPIASGQTIVITAGEPKPITLAGSDPENSPLNYVVVDPPKQGRLSGAGPMRTYTTDSTASGNDTFTFKVNDGKKDSPVATVSITINRFNQPPVSVDQTVVTTAGESKVITLNGSDPEKSSLTYLIVEQPRYGKLSGAGAERTYTTEAAASGNDSFTFKVNDGAKDSALAKVSIMISKVSQPAVTTNPTVVATQTVAVVAPENVASGAEIALLNKELKLYKIWFLREPPDEKILDPRTNRRAERMTNVGRSRETYKELANRLKGRYERLGLLTPELQKTFNDLLETIKTWP